MQVPKLQNSGSTMEIGLFRGQNCPQSLRHMLLRRRIPQSNLLNNVRYKHVVIPDLMDSELLKSVRTEILTHLHFTPKQTDIYSVSQTGDLANLSGLPSSELEALPSLLKLRNALYSQEFRDFLCSVTGVKALSGNKTDMSINSYERGGYLLTHDDVIGTRSVSFILYLVQGDVEGGWKEEWGGGLRLYKTSEEGVPENEPCLTIPPQWNQMSMFGKSHLEVANHSRTTGEIISRC